DPIHPAKEHAQVAQLRGDLQLARESKTVELSVERKIGQTDPAKQKGALRQRLFEGEQRLSCAVLLRSVFGDHSIYESIAVFSVPHHAPQRLAIPSLAPEKCELVRDRGSEQRVLQPRVDVVGQHLMHPAPARRQNRGLWIEFLEAPHNSRRIDDGL